MNPIREPAVAGRFYPADRNELGMMVRRFLDVAGRQLSKSVFSPGPVPKAIIVPHAGYAYSGPVAASAYAFLQGARGSVRRVVLLGTAHGFPFSGLATSGAEAFETPMGRVPVDREAIQEILSLPQVLVFDEAHAREHSLEVQLPFLQETLGSFALVPLAVGEASPGEVEEVLGRLWGGPETLIVVSSDLSHYHDDETARRMDQATSHAIEALEPQKISEDQACGRNAINGLLTAARHHGLKARTVDLRNSSDTAGLRDEVVGYGAYVLETVPPAAPQRLTEPLKKMLLQVAHRSIEHGLSRGAPLPVEAGDFPPELMRHGAAFVTVQVRNELRGCIGTIRAYRPLVEDVADNAFAAAFRDDRFRPVVHLELSVLNIHLSILNPLERMEVRSEVDLIRQMRPGLDGFLLEKGNLRGTLLPSMWESIGTPEEFLRCLKAKAGFSEAYWSPAIKVFRFTVQSIS